jgi:hypothetical protein
MGFRWNHYTGAPPPTPPEPSGSRYMFYAIFALVAIMVGGFIYIWRNPDVTYEESCMIDPSNPESPYVPCFTKGYEQGLKACK